MSLYPDVNIAYGSSATYNIEVLIDFKGINIYCDGSTKTPMIDDNSGILNFLVFKGSFVSRILPLYNIPCLTVSEITG